MATGDEAAAEDDVAAEEDLAAEEDAAAGGPWDEGADASGEDQDESTERVPPAKKQGGAAPAGS
ncbi:MAG: hypothetical protein MUF83_06190 [Acidimicrobiales bacterium]|nr:hypothetical protein [Acidimicrobiales bacterium]